LLRTTSPENITRGIARLLSPLHRLGIADQRFAQILSLSWNAFPYLWETARAAIRKANLRKAGNLKNLLPLLSNLIATLYLETGSTEGFWQQAYKSENKDPMEVVPNKVKTRPIKDVGEAFRETISVENYLVSEKGDTR
jgi:hypothetical protein